VPTSTSGRPLAFACATIRRLPPYADLAVHPSLARNLAARGYETATPVQAAVLEPTLAGRDLLVSSQTGSGKTVAFGTLIAQNLLATASPGETKAPRALVVAPTRELAAQVQRELEWLFAGTETRLAAFTGGTPVGGDIGRLRHRGVHLAVGTPGRLVDLHKRGALDLSAIEVLVLDEADEMLDLGFKEDLEHLLAQSPPERRTLLFSATLPREITRLAATYQRDPARVDPRSGAETAVHADIKYVAHLLRPQDRAAAIVNLLLAQADSRTIVFCRTRERVAELHQLLIDHGFRATAIAGDRAQVERDRALEALRAGRAQILVATNVAARGLDLPDVELVVHADLPDNAESLTHRSGRTGRAGKKGTSVVMADLRERRKAERLLASAGGHAPWSAPPTAEYVRRKLEDRLLITLLEEAKTLSRSPRGDNGHGQDVVAPAEANGSPWPSGPAILEDRLRASMPERTLVSLLVSRELGRLPQALSLVPVDAAKRERGPVLPARAREGARPAGGPGRPSHGRNWTDAVLFRVNLGAESKAEPAWLLPLICRRGSVTRKEVGAIRVGPRSSTFEIAADAASEFALAAGYPDPRAPHVIIEPAHAAAARPPARGSKAGFGAAARSRRGPPAGKGRPTPAGERFGR